MRIHGERVGTSKGKHLRVNIRLKQVADLAMTVRECVSEYVSVCACACVRVRMCASLRCAYGMCVHARGICVSMSCARVCVCTCVVVWCMRCVWWVCAVRICMCVVCCVCCVFFVRAVRRVVRRQVVRRVYL